MLFNDYNSMNYVNKDQIITICTYYQCLIHLKYQLNENDLNFIINIYKNSLLIEKEDTSNGYADILIILLTYYGIEHIDKIQLNLYEPLGLINDEKLINNDEKLINNDQKLINNDEKLINKDQKLINKDQNLIFNNLMTLINLLEYSLLNSLYNYHIHLLLIRLYCHPLISAIHLALKHFKQLNIREIQYDTLSHLIINDLLRYLALNDYLVLIKDINLFYQIYNKRTSRHMIEQVYKKLYYTQIFEFYQLQQRLNYSIIKSKINRHDLLIQLIYNHNSIQTIYQLYLDIQIQYNNHDYNIIDTYNNQDLKIQLNKVNESIYPSNCFTSSNSSNDKPNQLDSSSNKPNHSSNSSS